MAQLTSDCYAFGGKLTRIEEALAHILSDLDAITGLEAVPLTSALHKILAQNVASDENVPPENNSAVDGFAVFFDDLNETVPTELPVVGKATAGHPFDGIQKRGEAVQIFTGAVMPLGPSLTGPETVFMQEDCKFENGKVIVPVGIKRGSNRRLVGEDIVSGDCILEKGTRLRPQEIGLAASAGLTQLTVRKPLRVAVFSTGDEILEPGTPRVRGKIYDSNRFMLLSLLQALGCAVRDLGVLPDNPEVISKALASAKATQDVIITSGGVSTGEEDHVKRIIEEEGKLLFWRLAIKPGRPVAIGTLDSAFFIGLPGNPVAAMVTFLKVARPIILKLSGMQDVSTQYYLARTNFSYNKKPERREYIRVRCEETTKGQLLVNKFKKEGAGILTSMVFADGLVELPEESMEIKKGDIVRYFPFNEFGL